MRLLLTISVLLAVTYVADAVAHHGSPKFAIVTMCTCGDHSCSLFEYTHRMKDKYCRLHGCDHIIITEMSERSELFQKMRIYWKIVYAVLQTMNSPEGYEWIMLTGSDQMVLRSGLSISPLELIPEVIRNQTQWDIFVPLYDKTKNDVIMDYGLVDSVIIRNTEFSKQFVEKWLTYSLKGNYILEEQSAFNFEILAHLRDVLHKPPSVLDSMEKGGSATMYTSEPGTNIRKMNPTEYTDILRSWSQYNYNLLVEFYGPRPWNSTSIGRQQSKICLYETFDPTGHCYDGELKSEECGYDLNSGHNHSFFKHFSGPYKYTKNGRRHFLKWTRNMANSSNATIESKYCVA